MPLSSCAAASANCPDELSTKPILMVCCACAAPNAAASAVAINSFFIVPPPEGCGILTPDFAGDPYSQLELALLVVLGQLVAHLARREAALRREAQVLERHVLGSLVDAPLQLVLVFQARRLGGNQPQDHVLALRHEAQRLEAAGARGVVFEE